MRRTTWLLAAVLSPLLMAGCTTPGVTGPGADGGPRTASPDCDRAGTVNFPWQVCRIRLVWDAGRDEYKLPADLKLFRLKDDAPVTFVWILPSDPPGHFFERESLGLCTGGNGLFFDRGVAANEHGGGNGGARGKHYRVRLIQEMDLYREYVLTVKRVGTSGPPSYAVDPTIVNGNYMQMYRPSAAATSCLE